MIENNTSISQERQKFGYDHKCTKLIEHKVGDVVKIKNFRTRIGHSRSFEIKFLGPFNITKILGDLNYKFLGANGKEEIVHYNRMYLYRMRN